MISGLRVLVVEDEFLVAAMLEDELLDHGAEVIGPAATLADGVRLAGGGGFDAAVIDWNLDGEHSAPLAAMLREAGVPFVISTGYGIVPPDFAGCPLLTKPYDPGELIGLLGRLLKDRQA